jgi:hypothetical protein
LLAKFFPEIQMLHVAPSFGVIQVVECHGGTDLFGFTTGRPERIPDLDY